MNKVLELLQEKTDVRFGQWNNVEVRVCISLIIKDL